MSVISDEYGSTRVMRMIYSVFSNTDTMDMCLRMKPKCMIGTVS